MHPRPAILGAALETKLLKRSMGYGKS